MTSHDDTIVLGEDAVAAALVTELAAGAGGGDPVVWAAQGSEVIVYPDSVDVRLRPGLLRASVDLASDDTGRVSQPVELALAYPGESPNFTATAELAPAGDPIIAGRWGRLVQNAVWSAVLGLAGPEGRGVAADQGALLVYPEPVIRCS
jgi:hypothetical protein